MRAGGVAARADALVEGVLVEPARHAVRVRAAPPRLLVPRAVRVLQRHALAVDIIYYIIYISNCIYLCY